MVKYLIFLILGLWSTGSVFGLECYTSNLDSVLEGRASNYTHALEDCDDFFNKIFQLAGYGRRSLPRHIPIHCFTVFVESGEGNIVIKGCIPNDRCNTMKTSVRQRLTNMGHGSELKGVSCSACNTNGCNKPNAQGL